MTEPDGSMKPEDRSPQPSHSQSQWHTRSSMIRDLKLEEVSEERWQEFELIYKPLLLFWMRKKNVPASAEDEVLQECWLAVYEMIGKFERNTEKGTFRGWLRIICRNKVADYFRLLPKDNGVPQEMLNAAVNPEQKDADEIDEEEKALREIEARALEVIRSKTKEQTWKMFWMTTVENVPTAEVAQQFDVSKAAVRMAKQRVLKRLKELGFEV
ncbi:sigma-70 family RNA polymerase sigma factor [Gimesia sp.]|uniref:RNA polymerase sigma factor n=1 Tax=Gimesia sp. TaxID=2024833 RepID=UPI0032EEF1F6